MRTAKNKSDGRAPSWCPSNVFVRRLSPYYEHQLGKWIFSAGQLEREMDRRGLISLDACGVHDPLSIVGQKTQKPVGSRREFLKTYKQILEEGV